MATHISDAGAVTSWANNSPLISGGSAPSEFNVSLEAEEHETTAFTASIVSTGVIAGLRKATATIKTRTGPAKIGSGGLVTHAAGYAALARMWKIDMAWPAQDNTAFNSIGVTARTFMPGLLTWTGSYDSFIDTATAVPSAGGDAAAATFKIVENASADQTLAGNIIITKIDPKNKVGDLAMASITFRGDGNLTAAGTSGSGVGAPFYAAGTVTTAAGSLVLTSSSGRTYTGDAFPTRVSISVGVGDLIEVEITAQFTGVVTIA